MKYTLYQVDGAAIFRPAEEGGEPVVLFAEWMPGDIPHGPAPHYVRLADGRVREVHWCYRAAAYVEGWPWLYEDSGWRGLVGAE